jgi:uncharacterized protein YaaQ
MENRCDKLLLAILQGDDYSEVVADLNENGFYVTILNSSGGFLKKRSVTIMVGLASERLEEAIEILRKRAGRRKEVIYNHIVMPAGHHNMAIPPVIPTEVEVGGVTVFVMDLCRHEQL